MTLIAALQAALAEPPDLEPLRSMEPPPNTMSAHPLHSLVVSLLRFWLRDYDADRLERMKDPVLDGCMLLKRMGASDADLWSIHAGRTLSPEWTAAALRLAAWADGEVTPEPAPWDDSAAMSYEEIGDLVGL